MAKGALLCTLADLEPTGAKGVTLEISGSGAGRREIVVVATSDGARAYVNRCPHQGTPLEITPDRFVDSQRRTILCSTHGARFRVSDGYCFSGPCRDHSLDPVAIVIVDGSVHLVA